MDKQPREEEHPEYGQQSTKNSLHDDNRSNEIYANRRNGNDDRTTPNQHTHKVNRNIMLQQIE